jgi:hypothetical protein
MPWRMTLEWPTLWRTIRRSRMLWSAMWLLETRIMANYDIGDLVRLTGTFTVQDVLTDPSTITLRIKDPAGVEIEFTYAGGGIVRDGVGVYHYDAEIDLSGFWTYRWEGGGAVVTAGEKRLYVRTTAFTGDESA